MLLVKLTPNCGGGLVSLVVKDFGNKLYLNFVNLHVQYLWAVIEFVFYPTQSINLVIPHGFGCDTSLV